MRAFSSFNRDSSAIRRNSAPKTASKKDLKIPKRRPSDGDIRAKFASFKKDQDAQVTLSKAARANKIKQFDMPGTEATDKEFDPDKEFKGDVGLNHPNDPVTRGKLKTLVQSKAFNFGEKERAVLAQILKDDD